MLEFQEKRRVKRLIYSKLTLVVLLIIVGLLINGVWGVYKKRQITQNNLEKTTISFNNLKDREKVLTAEIERLNTDNGIEEEIREKYGLIKPGEEVIMIIDKKDSDKEANVSVKVSFWQKFLNWFK